MELRIDRLLRDLRQHTADILEAIDRDPLLLKRQSGELVLANASQKLYTPQQQHQLYAKGIVYQRNPYRLVSLPLIKIYNIGEREVTVQSLSNLAAAPDVQLRFLRKIDGSLIQVFRHEGRLWFTTRGLIEGAAAGSGPDKEESEDFDYVGTARRLAAQRYPRLFDGNGPLHERTLLFELIHPQARKVTNYGDRADLVLLGCFDGRRFAYWPYPQVVQLGAAFGLTVVDALSPTGATIAVQIDSLLAALTGTDEEGAVLQFECGGEVLYRVKVKSPEYLLLMRLLAECSYERTVAMLEENPALATWEDFEVFLKAQGRQRVPEEVLGSYRQHRERYLGYLADCERLRQWAAQTCARVEAQLGGRTGQEPSAYRKAFAALVAGRACSGLLFNALDGRLDLERVRKLVRTPDEATQMLRTLGHNADCSS